MAYINKHRLHLSHIHLNSVLSSKQV
uniref:Uncharacterized protein n=1 Tax=Arundo donax TaxID=35708 RepID=A0A0A8ZWW2_ARUDO